MAKVRINGDTSGYIELASPAAAGSNTITLPSSNGSANQLLKNSGTAGTLAWSTLTEDSSGNLSVDSGTLYVDASNNRVGIGTTSPRNVLDVNGTIYVAGGNQIQITGSGGTTGLQLIGQDAAESVIGTMSAQALAIRTNSTERLRIDSSGRLLIGTSNSPTQPQGQYGLLVVQGYAGSSTGEGIVSIQRGLGAASIASGGDIGRLVFGDSAGNTFAGIFVLADATPGAGDYPGRLMFATTGDGASTPTERFRINNGGTLYSANNSVSLGTETAVMSGGGRFTVHGDFFNSTAGAAFSTTNDSTGAIYMQFGNSAGTRIGSITRASSTSISFSSTSDYRLKENVKDVKNALEIVKQIRPVTFNFIGHKDEHSTGFIAHELQQIIPEAVSGTKDGIYPDGTPNYQGIDQSKLVPFLTAALQESIQRIEQLETLNASFEARLAALEVKP
jgi:hypothetical protein